MSDMTMVERVRDAIVKAALEMERDHDVIEDAERFARAAIEALRPMPDDMAKSLKGHFDNDVTFGQVSNVSALWDDAIDAILTQEKTDG